MIKITKTLYFSGLLVGASLSLFCVSSSVSAMAAAGVENPHAAEVRHIKAEIQKLNDSLPSREHEEYFTEFLRTYRILQDLKDRLKELNAYDQSVHDEDTADSLPAAPGGPSAASVAADPEQDLYAGVRGTAYN